MREEDKEQNQRMDGYVFYRHQVTIQNMTGWMIPSNEDRPFIEKTIYVPVKEENREGNKRMECWFLL